LLFTIGHSNHGLARFVELLNQHRVSAILDVRSRPVSRFHPHFNKAALERSLADAGIAYVFLGKELGARPADPACYVRGRVSYSRLAARPEFAEDLSRVREAMAGSRPALLCAERDPIECHRMILVSRRLRGPGVEIKHILADGTLETNEAAERRLCAVVNVQAALFSSEAEAIERAYELRSEAIAYTAKAKPEGGRPAR
jgi:uncharacterized protein (DUF488 family)